VLECISAAYAAPKQASLYEFEMLTGVRQKIMVFSHLRETSMMSTNRAPECLTDLCVTHGDLFVVHHNKPGDFVSEHQHEGHELVIPIAGSVHFVDAVSGLSCSVGSMVLILKGHRHQFRSDSRQGERLIAIFSANRLPSIGAEHGMRQLTSSQLVKELLYQLLLEQPGPSANILVEAFFIAFNRALAQQHVLVDISSLGSRVKDERILRAITLMSENLGEGYRISEIASKAGLSERSLQRLLHSETGLTPKELLKHIRVQRAMSLLKSGHYNVTQTAMEVGYSSLSQFIQTFKDLTGSLPSDFR